MSTRDKIEALLRESPGIKAREIASKLGLERRVVNVFLHGNEDRYRQDLNHGWSIAGTKLGISLPGKWVSSDDFEQALYLGGDALGGPEKEVVIYLPQGCSPMIDCTSGPPLATVRSQIRSMNDLFSQKHFRTTGPMTGASSVSRLFAAFGRTWM